MTTFTDPQPMTPSRRIRLAAAVTTERLPSGCTIFWVDWSKICGSKDT